METTTSIKSIQDNHGAPSMVCCGGEIGGNDEVRTLPVASTLRKLEVGQTTIFPIEQRSTVLNTLTRFRNDYARQGWDAEMQTNKQNFTVIVTRTN